MSRIVVFAVSAALLAAACGSDGPVDGALEPVTGTVPTAGVRDPSATLVTAEPQLAVFGATAVSVARGETVTIDHLVENLTGGTRTVAATARNATEGVVVDAAPSSLRLDAGGVAALSTTVRVPEDLDVDAAFELVVVFADDITARTDRTITVTAGAASGARPELRDDRAATTTNERVISYVVGNDADPDGDLDLSTLRIVAGADRGADVVAAPDGTVVYEPLANRTGTDVVLYELCDTQGNCDTASLTVTVEE